MAGIEANWLGSVTAKVKFRCNSYWVLIAKVKRTPYKKKAKYNFGINQSYFSPKRLYL